MSTRTANFEDIYPLTPFQQGMLFHVLDTPDAGLYLDQQRYTLRGEIDIPTFRKALQAVMDRHQILRTAFVLSTPEGPLQVVYRKLTLPWAMHDWSDLPQADAQERLNELLNADYDKGFDLQRAPLTRVTLVRTEPNLYEFIWSFHLLLMDGWSMQVILRELLALYHGMMTEQLVTLPAPMPYREFVKWLKQQPEKDAEVYWQNALKGFTQPTPLGFDRAPLTDVSDRPYFKETVVQLDEESSSKVRTFAQQHRLTLNTVIQGAWALLLSRRSGMDDVLFGSVVAGRSAVIPGIDSAVGVFVNAVPARIRLSQEAQVVPWLREVQKQQAEARRFDFCSLVRVQGWSEVPRTQPLFQSVVIFQNFPVTASIPESASVKVVGVSLVERSNLPLALVVEPGTQFLFRAIYMGNRFDEATIDRILENVQRILVELANKAEAPLSTVFSQVNTERQLLIDSFNQSLATL